MDFFAYQKLAAVNWSTLRWMRVSPKHFKHAATNPSVDAARYRVGRAMHALVLEPALFPDSYVCWGGRRQGKLWKEFEAANSGKTILSIGEWTKAQGAAAAVLTNPIAADYLSGQGLVEFVLTWDDEATGLACKCRIDYADVHLVELKSTASIECRRFAATAARMGYPGQLAFYLDGLRANGVDVADEPAIITVESAPPFDVAPYLVPEPIVELGRREYRRLLEQVKSCRETDTWPGVATSALELVLPEWAHFDPTEEMTLTLGGEALDL